MTESGPSPLKVAILGGGITGLTAAYTIARARQGGAPVDELLIEASDRVGGLIRTDKFEGFTIEAGPDSFLSAKPEASRLCDELALDQDLIGSNDAARQTYILHRGSLEVLPDGLMFFVPARLRTIVRSRLIPFPSKLAILRDAFRFRPVRPTENDESVADFVRRRLGSGMLETVVDPLLAGIYGGDSAQLSARAVLPALVEMERRGGSLVRGVMRARKAAPPRPTFTSLKSGLEELPRALAAQFAGQSGPASPRVALGQRVESIDVRRGEAESPRRVSYTIRCRGGKIYEAGSAILALPATECSRLLAPIDRGLSENLARIPYTPAITIALAYRDLDPRLPGGFGFLVPRRERRRLLACTFVHAKFSHRAPLGGALLRCFLGGAHQPDVVQMSDADLLGVVHGELREILGVTQPPAFQRVYRWPVAMPQYLVGHEDRVAKIQRGIRQHRGLFLAGNAYHGVGISDCIRSASRAAEDACKLATDAD